MRVYLAARYSRRLELCRYRDALRNQGIEVTSRWLDGEHQIGRDGPIGPEIEALIESGTTEPEIRGQFAAEDWADVMAADVMVNFTEQPRSGSSRGGRHVEFGAALAAGKRCIVVGPRENVFHCLPQVEHYDEIGPHTLASQLVAVSV